MKIIKNIIEEYPFIRPIIILLKYFLRQRNLNETFTGGISSYLLFNLVYAYIQFISKDKNEIKSLNDVDEEDNDSNASEEKDKNILDNLSSFLLGFLKFYGYEFNYQELGISIRDGGEFYMKSKRNYPYNENLSVENFQDISLDIGRAVYKFPRIRSLFQEVLNKLYKVKSNSDSYLKHMIIVTSEMRKYAGSV
jgi:non-canonical poly(A) RNA polymerase PAPD5/7